MISFTRGDYGPKTLTVRYRGTLQPFDLTGCTVILAVDTRQNPDDDSTQVFKLTGVIDSDPTTGIVVFDFLEVHTILDYKVARYYGIQVSRTGFKKTLKKGQYIITQDIVKD